MKVIHWLIVATLIAGCGDKTGFHSNSPNIEKVDNSDATTPEEEVPVEVQEIEEKEVSKEKTKTPPVFSLSCDTLLSNNYSLPGEHTCKDCPVVTNDPAGYTRSLATSVMDVTSQVSSQNGDGIWCLESLDGQGKKSGTVKNASDGTFTQKIPLFCGNQKIAFGWENAKGLGVATYNVTRTSCSNGGIHLTLTWGAGANDLELHLIRAGGTLNNLNGDFNDCTWTNLNPDWGIIGDTTDNPKKDIDWLPDNGIENIELPKNESVAYEVYVEYWASGIASNPQITLNIDGKTLIKTISNFLPRQVWHTATVTPSGSVVLHQDVIDCSGNWSGGCRMTLP